MMQHDRDALPDVCGDTRPRRTRPKRERLWRVFAERRREKLQRLDVGIIHDLSSLSVKCGRKRGKTMEWLTSFSSPVR